MNHRITNPTETFSVDELLERVRTREDLVTFVRALIADLKHHPETWENTGLQSYLDGMEGWLHDMEGYYRNKGEPMPEQPTWKMLAQILRAASVYE